MPHPGNMAVCRQTNSQSVSSWTGQLMD